MVKGIREDLIVAVLSLLGKREEEPLGDVVLAVEVGPELTPCVLFQRVLLWEQVS